MNGHFHHNQTFMFSVLTMHVLDRGLLYQGPGLWARRVYFQQLHCFSIVDWWSIA